VCSENPPQDPLTECREEITRLQAQVKKLSNPDPNWATKYQVLSETRNVELAVYWTRYEVMAALHVGLLGALLATDRGLCLPSELLAGVGAIGLLMGIAWGVFAWKGAAWVMAWNTEMEKAEDGHPWQPQKDALRGTRTSEKADDSPRKTGAITKVSRALPLVFASLWLLLAIDGIFWQWVSSAVSCQTAITQ